MNKSPGRTATLSRQLKSRLFHNSLVTGLGGSGISSIARKISSLYSISPFLFNTARRLRTKSTSNGNNFFADSVSVGLLRMYNFEGLLIKDDVDEVGEDKGLVMI